MATTAEIASIGLPADLPVAGFWTAWAGAAQAWLAQRGLPIRAAVVLLPFVELLPHARQAWADLGGWQPRIETTRTLAASLGPAPLAGPGAFSGQAAVDTLVAAQLLDQVPAWREWRQRDRRACAQAAAELRQAAQTLARGAAARPPAQREAWWALARQVLGAVEGDARLDALLAQLAMAWAETAPAPASDRLFDLTPSAWVVLEAGGSDDLAEALLADAAARAIPALRLRADPPGPDPFAAAPLAAPRLWIAADAEAEALAAACAVAQAVSEGRIPVALIAEDRAGVRRIRALLERIGLGSADESGWSLSTTRAGARLMALLRAAQPQASADAWLDWLKSEQLPGAEAAGPIALDWLERRWRRVGSGAAADPAAPADDVAALAWWASQKARLDGLVQPGQRPLAAWLQALRGHLLAAPDAARWRHDPAGQAVWQALALDSASAWGDGHRRAMALDDLIDWIDATLSDSEFRPADPDPQVLITPMARAMLRPFGQIVFAGADERRLGPATPGPALLSEATLRALGLADAQARGERGALCFVQLLRQPGLLLLRRQAEGDEILGPSRWWTRLRLAYRRRGLAEPSQCAAPQALTEHAARPVLPPLARADGRLPGSVSASAIDALRSCPYHFFARSVLRLAQAEELEADSSKRDYGSLLHALLQRFHDQRDATQTRQLEAQALVEIGNALVREQGLDAATLLPFLAGLPAFAERYLDWLLPRDAQGWAYAGGELDRSLTLGNPAGLVLRGRIDRLDQGRQEVQQLLDYKTGSLSGLKAKLRQPFEDTQLAFYAAQLLGAGADPDKLSAAYVALDERGAVVEVEHPNVADSALALLAGLAADWARLNAGEPMRALGEGQACDFCEARGLCRRDHWLGDPLADLSTP